MTDKPDAPAHPDAPVSWRVARLILEAGVRTANAVTAALGESPPRQAAVDVIVGGAAVATDRLAAATRSIGRVLGPPRALSRLAARGRRERAAAAADLERLAATLVPAVTAALLDRLDLTGLVRDRVALDTLVAEVDLDAVAARIDIGAIVDRLDLVTLANTTIDGIDLPEIIRESTDSITSYMVRGVRTQGVEADRAVAGLVGRLLRRPAAEASS